MADGIIFFYSQDVIPVAVSPDTNVPSSLVLYVMETIQEQIPMIMAEGYERIDLPVKNTPVEVAHLEVTSLQLSWSDMGIREYEIKSSLGAEKLQGLLSNLPGYVDAAEETLEAPPSSAESIFESFLERVSQILAEDEGMLLPGTGLFGQPLTGMANRRRRFKVINLRGF